MTEVKGAAAPAAADPAAGSDEPSDVPVGADAVEPPKVCIDCGFRVVKTAGMIHCRQCVRR